MIRNEVPTGVIDGSNATFGTQGSTPYASGSLSVYMNGQKISPDFVDQVDPGAGLFTILEPRLIPKSRPGAGKSDCLSIDYDDGISTIEIREVDLITCEIVDGEDLDVIVSEPESLVCDIEDGSTIHCLVIDSDSVIVTIEEPEGLSVQIEDC